MAAISKTEEDLCMKYGKSRFFIRSDLRSLFPFVKSNEKKIFLKYESCSRNLEVYDRNNTFLLTSFRWF